MTPDQLSALKSRLELAVNETTGEFSEDLRAAVRVVAAMEKLEAMKHGREVWVISEYTFHPDLRAYVGTWGGDRAPENAPTTLIQAVEKTLK